MDCFCQPKGVVIKLSNALNIWSWWEQYFKIDDSDLFLLFSSSSFIMSLWQWLPPLTKESTVVIPKNVMEFESAIVECRVNKLICTPSALAILDPGKIQNLDAIQVACKPPQRRTMEEWNRKIHSLHSK